MAGVTPVPGQTTQVQTGGTPVQVFPGGVSGGVITNPSTITGQGLPNLESIFVDPVGAANTDGNDTTFELQPGQSWEAIPGQTTPTTVNALTDNHKFSAVYW